MNRYIAMGLGVMGTALVYFFMGLHNPNLKKEETSLSKKMKHLETQNKIKEKYAPSSPTVNEDLSEVDFLKLTPSELESYKKEIDRKLKQSELIIRANNKLLSESDRTELKNLLKNYGLATEAEINLMLNTK